MITYTYVEEDSLTHHGVKGMKWGHRKARTTSGVSRSDQKVARYQSKELKRLDKTYNANRANKRIAKAESRLEKVNTAKNVDQRKVDRAKSRLTAEKTQAYYQAGMKAAESKKIKNMKISDVKYEKKQVGKQRALAGLSMVGAVAVANMGGVGFYTTSDAKSTKTMLRTSADFRSTTANKAYKKAKKEVYGH